MGLYEEREFQHLGLTLHQTDRAFTVVDAAGTELCGWSKSRGDDVEEMLRMFILGYRVGIHVARRMQPDPHMVVQPLCEAEHGYSFADPITALIQQGEAVDVSWHNDVAASVANPGDVIRVRLWDHGPGEHDPDDESGGVRFCVTTNDSEGDYEGEAYEGDDVDAAVAAFRAAVEAVR